MSGSAIRHQQKQKYAERQIELLNEFQYTIIQDMQNVLGIALEFYAVEEKSQQLDPELVKVQKNRLILQYNLSNTIHVDQWQTAESKSLVPDLSKQKIQAQEMFTKIKQDLYKAIPKLQASGAGKILEDYQTNNLALENKIIQQPLERTNVKANFNQDVVAQVLGAMQTNDQIYDEIRNAKELIVFDDAKKIMDNALHRFVNAQVKLQEVLVGKDAEIIVEQTTNQAQVEQQNVAQFVSLFFSGLANYFTQPNYLNQIMLQGVIVMAHQEKKIDLQKLHKHLQQALKHIPEFDKLFDMLINYLDSVQEIYNPCAILPNIKPFENSIFFLKQYQSDKNSKEFWQIKANQFVQINYYLLQVMHDILLNKKLDKVNFPVTDNYDLFLKRKIIEYHFQQMVSAQTKDLLYYLRDEDKYPKPVVQMSLNVAKDLDYIKQNLGQMHR